MPIINFRVSHKEKEKIDTLSHACGLIRSEYLRQTALNFTPKSKLDKQLTHQLFLLQGDIGRLGGLFKLWLSDKEYKSVHRHLNIPELVDEIRLLKLSIQQLIERL